MFRATIAAACLMISTTAIAGEAKTLTADDFFVDWRDLLGQQITVTGCQMGRVMMGMPTCAIRSGGPIRTGTIFLDERTMNREDLRRTVKTCAADPRREDCIVSISGVVTRQEPDFPLILKAKIMWPSGS